MEIYISVTFAEEPTVNRAMVYIIHARRAPVKMHSLSNQRPPPSDDNDCDDQNIKAFVSLP